MNKTRWLVAKYMSDLRRREPENVGVVLIMKGRICSRFFGQRPDGKLDGRVVSRSVGSYKNYKAWVEYWTRTIEESSSEDVAAQLTQRSGDENYLIEFGGERIVGSSAVEPEDMLDYLYRTLVDQTSSRTSLSVARLSERVFDALQIRDKVKRDFQLDLGNDIVPFDYRYDNGQANLMQRVSLVTADERSWDNVHIAAYAASKVASAGTVQGKKIQVITLVKPREQDGLLDKQLSVLRATTEIVDLSNHEIAASHLARLLHVHA